MKTKYLSAMTMLREMRTFLLLWATQAFSGLGSAMTSYALIVWSYTQDGSALVTALLSVASYAPYVICSIFAGALSDRWDKRRTMLVCDLIAALTTVTTLVLLKTGHLQVWHLYLLNALNGLMNTVQQPASEVATTALLPRRYYQKAGGLSQLSSSLNGILTPMLAMALIGVVGLEGVIYFDLTTFAVAFLTLLFFIRIPGQASADDTKEPLSLAVRQGVGFLRRNPGIFALIMFLAAINLVASMYNAALPAMLLSREGGGETVMGFFNSFTAVTMLIGSLVASALPAPKSRVRVVAVTLLISMSTENFFLAFGRSLPVWCVGAFLGWFVIPIMNTNLGTIMRLNIPQALQGRVYAARNSLQFFTIPVGYLLGGAAVDMVFEPLMAAQADGSVLLRLFGEGKGSGAACFFAVLGVTGVMTCLIFCANRHLRAMQAAELREAAER